MFTRSDRKEEILKSAAMLKRTAIYVPGSDDYVEGFRIPTATTQYRSGFEPHVDVCVCRNAPSQAWLTVNRYNAVVLNSRNMLMIDIDFGDERFSRFAGARDEDDVVAAIKSLNTLDAWMKVEHFADREFAKHSYRVYRTHSGCRVICTSKCFPQGTHGYLAYHLMMFVKADRQYMKLCDVQKCYRARLTPKPWRCNGLPSHVCDLVHTAGPGEVHPELEEQLALHDEMTLCRADSESVLA